MKKRPGEENSFVDENRRANRQRMNLAFSMILVFSCFVFSRTAAGTPGDIEALLSRMETAYSKVTDYQATVKAKTFKSDGSSEMQQFLYTFKKPKQIRLDFESPHRGMEMVYPDQNGKVAVHLPGLWHLLKFHLTRIILSCT